MKKKNKKCGPLLTKLKQAWAKDKTTYMRLAAFGQFTSSATVEAWVKRASIPDYHVERVVEFLNKESNGNPS